MTAAWILRRSFRRIARRKRGFAASAAAFAAVTALGTAAVGLGRWAAETAARFSEQTHVIVYLDHGLAEDRAQALVHALEQLPEIAAVRAVGSAAAKQRLRAAVVALGEDPAVLSQVEDGFLPRSLEIALRPGPDLPAEASDLARRLGHLGGVAAVDAMKEGLGRVASWVALARRLGITLGVIAAGAALALILGTIGRERARRQGEADTLALLGATPLEARLPACLTGVLAALVGTSVGVVIGAHAAAMVAGRSSPVGALGRGEVIATVGLVCAAGLVAGLLSLPRARVVDAG